VAPSPTQAVTPATEPGPSRHIVTALSLLALFAILGQEALRGRVFGWDTVVWRFLHGHEEAAHGSILDRFANLVVEVGGNTATLLIGLLSVVLLLGLRRRRDALFVIATGVAVLVATPLLKELFERSELKYSFPSGNSARSAALVTAVILIAWHTRARWPTVIAGIALTATIGVALVWEDWHLPSDVVGGWCLGILCAMAFRAGLVSAAPRPSRA